MNYLILENNILNDSQNEDIKITDIDEIKNISQNLLDNIDETNETCQMSLLYLHDVKKLYSLSNIISTIGISKSLYAYIDADKSLSAILAIKLPSIENFSNITNDSKINSLQYKLNDYLENSQEQNKKMITNLYNKITKLNNSLQKWIESTYKIKRELNTNINKCNKNYTTVSFISNLCNNSDKLSETISNLKYNIENIYNNITLSNKLHLNKIIINKNYIKNITVQKSHIKNLINSLESFIKLGCGTNKVLSTMKTDIDNILNLTYYDDNTLISCEHYVNILSSCSEYLKIIERCSRSIIDISSNYLHK